jgi:MerR family redox-sensitive transcriptional activator SoxR
MVGQVPHPGEVISIGALARRTGVSVSAVRFYEAKGLIKAERNAGGQRRFPRAHVRRLSFVLIAQQLGLSLEEIATELAKLPENRTPTASDWEGISQRLLLAVEARITALTRVRDRLTGCIGCGCLSLKNCALYNPQDKAGSRGPGARFLLEDSQDSD